MQQKYFLLDKNYILKDVQQRLRGELLSGMVDVVIQTYLLRNNPLGLQDDPVQKMQNYHQYRIEDFYEFYNLLCGVYRYRLGTNQLDILFDGKTHYEKYRDDWKSEFSVWITKFCEEDRFVKMSLALTVFYEDDKAACLVKGRLKNFIGNFFNIKIYRYKGIMTRDVA